MSNLNLIYRQPNNKKITFNTALLQLSNDPKLLELDAMSIEAVRFLIMTSEKKVVAPLKTNDPFKLASLFMAKNDIRYYLNHIYSDGKQLIASNGHVLIRVQHECQEGFYTKAGIREYDADYAKFPDFTKAFQKVNDKMIAKIIDGEKRIVTSKMTGKQVTSEMTVQQVTGISDTGETKTEWFNRDYLALVKRIKPDHISLGDDVLYFKGSNFDGIVMPIRV